MKLHPYKENDELTWRRKVIAAGFAVFAGAVVAFLLVTWFIVTFVKPY